MWTVSPIPHSTGCGLRLFACALMHCDNKRPSTSLIHLDVAWLVQNELGFMLLLFYRYTVVRGRPTLLRHSVRFPRTLMLLDGHDQQVRYRQQTSTHLFIAFNHAHVRIHFLNLIGCEAKQSWCSKTCVKQPLNFVFSQDWWSLMTGKVNIIL